MTGTEDGCPATENGCAMAGEDCPELGEGCPKTGPDCPKVAPTAERGAEDRPQSNALRFLGKSASRTDVDSRSTANSRLAPTTVTDSETHACAMARMYELKLTVRDDDSGENEVLIVIVIAGQGCRRERNRGSTERCTNAEYIADLIHVSL